MQYKQKIINTFNNFNGENLQSLHDFYHQDVVFIDPVTQVEGLTALQKYYAHAYRKVISIRFDFADMIVEDLTYAAPWTMRLKVKGLNSGQEFTVKGLSLLKFNQQGLVTYHRDYVDLGEMVYERLPVVGTLVRQIKKLLKL